MKKHLRYCILIALFLLYGQNSFSLIIIRSEVIGWAHVQINIHTSKNGLFTIERKENQGNYQIVARTAEKVFIDRTTEKNKQYIYRVTLDNGFSNTEEIDTHTTRIIMKNRNQSPHWVGKHRFDSERYHFRVAVYQDNYRNENDNKRNFLISLLKEYTAQQISDNHQVTALSKLFSECITGQSLITGKPYMEKRRILLADKAFIETTAHYLYGIKKSEVKRLLKKFILLMQIEKAHSHHTSTPHSAILPVDIQKINEPALQIRLQFVRLKNLLVERIASGINRERNRKNIHLMLVRLAAWRNTNSTGAGYVFRPSTLQSQSESLFTWQGSVFQMEKLLANLQNFAEIIINRVITQPSRLLNDSIRNAAISLNMENNGLNITMQMKIAVQ